MNSTDAPEAPRIVVGVMSPMTAKNMRIGGRSSASGAGVARVDLAYARDLAERRCGPAAEAAIGRALLGLAAQGQPLEPCAQAMSRLLLLAEGVKSGTPSALAVQAANALVSPEGVMQTAGQEGANDLYVLAYATLHLDEKRRLDGGVS
jgi:hypothetical protein